LLEVVHHIVRSDVTIVASQASRVELLLHPHSHSDLHSVGLSESKRSREDLPTKRDTSGEKAVDPESVALDSRTTTFAPPVEVPNVGLKSLEGALRVLSRHYGLNPREKFIPSRRVGHHAESSTKTLHVLPTKLLVILTTKAPYY
jgi:hypothetical protein